MNQFTVSAPRWRLFFLIQSPIASLIRQNLPLLRVQKVRAKCEIKRQILTLLGRPDSDACMSELADKIEQHYYTLGKTA
jgi:hypothetical protein